MTELEECFPLLEQGFGSDGKQAHWYKVFDIEIFLCQLVNNH